MCFLETGKKSLPVAGQNANPEILTLAFKLALLGLGPIKCIILMSTTAPPVLWKTLAPSNDAGLAWLLPLGALLGPFQGKERAGASCVWDSAPIKYSESVQPIFHSAWRFLTAPSGFYWFMHVKASHPGVRRVNKMWCPGVQLLALSPVIADLSWLLTWTCVSECVLLHGTKKVWSFNVIFRAGFVVKNWDGGALTSELSGIVFNESSCESQRHSAISKTKC